MAKISRTRKIKILSVSLFLILFLCSIWAIKLNWLDNCGFPPARVVSLLSSSVRNAVPPIFSEFASVRGDQRFAVAFSPNDHWLVTVGSTYTDWLREPTSAPSRCDTTWIMDLSAIYQIGDTLPVVYTGIETFYTWHNFEGEDILNLNNQILALTNRQILNLESKTLMTTLIDRQRYPIPAIIISPDDQYIITTEDNELLLWDSQSLETVRTLSEHSDYITDVDYGLNLASVSNDGTIIIWNLETGEPKSSFRVLYPYNYRIYIDQNNFSDLIAYGTSSTFPRSLPSYVANSSTGALYMRFEEGIPEFSPDGNFVLVKSRNKVNLWNVESRQLLFNIEMNQDDVYITEVTMNSLGDLIAIGRSDGIIEIYSLDGHLAARLQIEDYLISGIAFNHGGNFFAATWRDQNAGTGGLQVWSVQQS